jgi:glycogen debranching enzyme
MWLWDSAFHALSFSTYNMPLAEEILLAMLKRMRSDGFMPHMTNPTDSSDVTQPCVLSWAVYKLYEKSHNVNFLKEALYYLDKYLTYDLNNRDNNHNGLLEWKTEPDYELCKCGESGLDNSPRFDFDVEMDVIDFSSYFALDTHYLAKIYEALGDNENASKWEEISKNTANKINELLFDEETGAYYDRLFTGELTKVLTHSSFLPMFAEITTKEKAEKLVKTMFDENELYTEAPLASISKKDPRFSTDMWRGGVWVNLNYFNIVGLKKYGYLKEAEELRTKTLEMINKWFKQTGCVFEFYDPNNEISPFYLERKGKPLKNPDYRKHVHSISDFHWSACFALLLIQGEY